MVGSASQISHAVAAGSFHEVGRPEPKPGSKPGGESQPNGGQNPDQDTIDDNGSTSGRACRNESFALVSMQPEDHNYSSNPPTVSHLLGTSTCKAR